MLRYVSGAFVWRHNRQTIMMISVEGMVIAQYSHICLETCRPSSPKLKNVVLKKDYNTSVKVERTGVEDSRI